MMTDMKNSFFSNLIKRGHKNRGKIALFIVVLIAAFISSQYLWFNLSGNGVRVADYTIIRGEHLSIESFVSIPNRNQNQSAHIFRRSAKPLHEWDTLNPGEQQLRILIFNRAGYFYIAEPVLKVVDGHLSVFIDDEIYANEISANHFIFSETATPELVFVPEKPVFDAETGRYIYDCTIRLDSRDIPCELYFRDKTPPVITGARDIETTQGQAIFLRNGVSVEDNYDGNIKLLIESEAVSSKPGIYQATYRAIDESGNESFVTVKVTVVRAEEVYAYEKADEILAEILHEDMSMREKATAIFRWVRSHMRYRASSNEEDVILGAYEGLMQKSGNCFTFYAVCEILLTQAGIPNMHIERPPDYKATHHWNLVNVEEGWYHFDTYPTKAHTDGCLFTDSQAREYTELLEEFRPRYYDYVQENYPPVVSGDDDDNDDGDDLHY